MKYIGLVMETIININKTKVMIKTPKIFLMVILYMKTILVEWLHTDFSKLSPITNLIGTLAFRKWLMEGVKLIMDMKTIVNH